MGYKKRTSFGAKAGYTLLGGLVGFGLSTYIAAKKFNRQEAAYHAMIDGKDAEIVAKLAEYDSEMAEYQKKLSDPNFLLEKYNVVVKESGLAPAEGCANPAELSLVLTANEGSCLQIRDSVTGTKNPVRRLNNSSIVAGDYANAAIEGGKKKIDSTINTIEKKVQGWLD